MKSEERRKKSEEKMRAVEESMSNHGPRENTK
jgi:hypothetical protein